MREIDQVDQAIAERVLEMLRTTGDHLLMFRLDLLQALVKAYDLLGQHDRARACAMERLELARARDRDGHEDLA